MGAHVGLNDDDAMSPRKSLQVDRMIGMCLIGKYHKHPQSSEKTKRWNESTAHICKAFHLEDAFCNDQWIIQL